MNPTDDGQSPLAKITDWVNTTCPKAWQARQAETDTMPQWLVSSWYFLRYCDPHNDDFPRLLRKFSDYWMPVDWYNGGKETHHPAPSSIPGSGINSSMTSAWSPKEPYQKRTSHGMVLGEDGQKMSKSRGNVVNPDEVIAEYGADTMRLYEMFIGDFEKPHPGATRDIKGCKLPFLTVSGLCRKMSSSETATAKRLKPFSIRPSKRFRGYWKP